MANITIPELVELVSVAADDLLHIIDVSDTSESASGTSKKLQAMRLVLANAATYFSGGGTLALGGYTLTAAKSGTVATTGDLLTYDEGSWTPQLYLSGSPTGITYTTQKGRYVQVGNMVVVQAEINFSSLGAAASSAIPLLYGFPVSFHSGITQALSFWQPTDKAGYVCYSAAGQNHVSFIDTWTKATFSTGVTYRLDGSYATGSFS